jgi:predicted permease
MGALTSLLVLASLLASIEENLPKTSYFKKIDVWFMSYIIFIFVIICFHICVDFWIKHEDQVNSQMSINFHFKGNLNFGGIKELYGIGRCLSQLGHKQLILITIIAVAIGCI